MKTSNSLNKGNRAAWKPRKGPAVTSNTYAKKHVETKNAISKRKKHYDDAKVKREVAHIEKQDKSKEVNIAYAAAKNKMNDSASGDPRYATDVSAPQYQVEAPYFEKGVKVNPVLNPASFDGVSCSLLQRALTMGWQTESVQDVVNAGDFIKKILINAAAGSEPITMHIPSYLQTLQLSVGPKSINCKKQLFDLAFDGVPTGESFTSQQTYGSVNTTGVMNFGSIGTQVGQYGLSIVDVQSASTDQSVESQSYVKLTEALSAADRTNKKSHLPLPPEEVNYLTETGAAFACPTVVYGNAFGGTGGDVVRVGNEVPTVPDVLSVFAQPASSFSQAGRAPNYNSSRGGGAMESVFFTSNHKPSTLQRLTRPVIKYINFNDLFYVYCKSLQLAVQLYINNPDALIVSEFYQPGSQALFNTVKPDCTLLEAALAFRNMLMSAFSTTQWATNSLTPTNTVDETFLGLTSCVGTCPIPLTTPLQMSIYLTENIRALTARRSRDDDGNLRWFLPVLGVYTADEFSGDEFMITLNEPNATTTQVNLFAADSLYERKTGKKPKVEVKKEKFLPNKPVNSPKVKPHDCNNPVNPIFPHENINIKKKFSINIHDGNSPDGPLAINNPEFLQTITNALNNCSSAVAKFIQSRGVFSTAPSCNVLTQVGNTCYIVRQNNDTNPTTYAGQYGSIGVTSCFAPSQPIIEGFPFVMPTRVCNDSSLLLEDNVDVKVTSSTNGETFQRSLFSGNIILNYRDYLDSVAQNCVGDGKEMNVIKRINEASAKGMGGVASSLLNTFAPIALPLIGHGLDAIESLF